MPWPVSLSSNELHLCHLRSPGANRLAGGHLLENSLTALFSNLLSNAIKYRSAQAPRIHFSATKEGRWQIFCVADNGIGMKAEYSDRIFGVFKTAAQGRVPRGGCGPCDL